MRSGDSLSWFRAYHEELLAERDGYYGGDAPRGEIARWVARRLEETALADGRDNDSKSTGRDLVAVWRDLVALYQEFDDETSRDEYQARIISLLHAFEYPIPSRIVAGIVGCSRGHARRFYWDDTQERVRKKAWARRQQRWQASPSLVAKIRTLDSNRCVRCGSENQLVVHHIRPVTRGGEPTVENLVTLCERCHVDAHGGNLSEGSVVYDSPDFWTWTRATNPTSEN